MQLSIHFSKIGQTFVGKYLISQLQESSYLIKHNTFSVSPYSSDSARYLTERKKKMVLWLRYGARQRSQAPQTYSWSHHRFPVQSEASHITSPCLHFLVCKSV